MLGVGKNTVEIVIAAKYKAQAAFAKANAQMKTMKGGAGRLGGAMNTLKGSVSNATSSLGSFGAALGPIGIAVAAAAAVMATLGGAAFKASLEFEKAFAAIRVSTGATGETLAGLKEDFKGVFGAIPQDAAAVSGALAAMNTTTGASGETLQDLTTNILEVSRMLGEDGVGNAQSFGEALKQWQTPAEEGTVLMDQLFKITQDTGIGFGELTGAMNAYGPVLQNAGFTAAESAELFGRLEGSGIAVSRVMPGLNAAFRKWAEAGADSKTALEATIGAIANAETKMEALTIATQAFGAEGAQRMATAVRNGTFELSKLGETLEGTSGLIEAAAVDTLLFGDKWTLLKNKVTVAIAPIGDAIKNVLGSAIDGLSSAFGILQKVVGPAFNFILLKFKVLQAFLEGFTAPIVAALAPLKESFDALQQKFKETSEKLSLLNDIFTIITGVAKWLGEALGKVVAMALTPLVAKLKEGIDMLAAFSNKLGPIKSALKWLGEGVHNVADSFRETKPAIEEVTEVLEELKKEASKAPKAVAVAWALAVKSFKEGAGSYKEAIDGITKKINDLTKEYMTATDKRKVAIEKEVDLLRTEEDGLKDLKKTAEDTLSGVSDKTEEATEKMEEFSVSIGDTTVSFKGAAAEVVKNAAAYEKLQNSAQTLIDLDWSIFTEFEASLPNIEVGLVDLESSFVGFKGILEDNIDALENVQEAIVAINEIAAPFTDKGFLKGIESIAKFASALKTAGGAINDFSSLQDVSIEGCINFSLHVRDMVSALEILESQMEDLVPSFGKMDSLITDIVDTFVYAGDRGTALEKDLVNATNMVTDAFSDQGVTIDQVLNRYNYWRETGETTTNALSNAFSDLNLKGTNATETFYEFYNLLGEIEGESEKWGWTFAEDFVDALNAGEDLNVWAKDYLHTSDVLTFQMDKQTNALKDQTKQLAKITEALQPYLEFMRTLNELAALSTLSTEELNNGLNAINDTLVNLGKALRSFDLRSAMEGLFAPDTESAKGFMDVMGDYNTDFLLFASTLTRVTEVIGILSLAMKNAAGMIVTSSKDMEAAMKLIPAQLEEIETFLRTDLWGQIVAMLFAVNVEWEKFEDILETTSFSKVVSTLSSLIGLMDSMKGAFSDTGDQVVISAHEIESAVALIPAQLEELEKFLMGDLWGQLVSMIFAVNVQWEKWAFAIEDTDFTKVTSVLSSLIGLMDSMKTTFAKTSEQVVISAEEIARGLDLVDEQLEELETYLMSASWDRIVSLIFAVGAEWQKDAEIMDDYMPSFNAAVDTISTLASKVLSLSQSLSELRDMTVLSVRDIDEALKNIPVFLDRFVDALALNMYAIKESLKDLDIEWAKHAEEMKATMPAYEDSTSQIGKLIGSLLSLHSAMESLSEMGTISEQEFGIGFKSLMESITNFATSFSKNAPALIESLWNLERVWLANQTVIAPLMENFLKITENFWMVANNANAMADAFRDLQKNSGSLEKGFKSLIDFINQVVKATKEFYTTEAANELATYIEDVGKVIKAFVDLEKELETAMAKIEKAVSDAVEDMKGDVNSISDINDSMYINGLNTIQSYINGLIDKEPELIAQMAFLAGIIKGYLGVESPTKLGPLRNLDQWPRNLIQSFSSGLESEMHTLNTSFATLVPGLGAGAVGGNRNVNLYVTQYIADAPTADYANQSLTRLLSRHEVM